MEVNCLTSHHGSLIPRGKSPWYPLDKKLGGPQSQSERGGKGEQTMPLPGIKSSTSSLQPTH